MAVNKKLFYGAALGCGLVALVSAGAANLQGGAAIADSRSAVNDAASATASAPGVPMSFADIFERVAPAVVSIDVTSKIKANEAVAELAKKFGMPLPKEFRTPHKKTNPPNPDSGQDDNDDDSPAAMASGSGFFISSDGYIVTNNHVVADSDSITVRLNDKRELKAKIIGRDEATDLAVIKVEGKDFPFVTFENRAKPRVGDWVIAVGNPFTLGGTATAGIVSAYGRDIGDSFVDFLQIDAPINRGNSGGPTFDLFGRVIGVNTAIFSPSGGSVGIGFAIPADIAERITKDLMTGKVIVRGYLGVSVGPIAKDVGESLGVLPNHGVLVVDTTPDGPADKAGIRSGDVILSINSQNLTGPGSLTRAVALTPPGDIVHLKILREGKNLVLNVKSGTRPAESVLRARLNGEEGALPDLKDGETAKPGVLGLSLSPMKEELRRKFDIHQNIQGVVILDLADESEAKRKGLRPGDVIVSVNQKPISNEADLKQAITEAKKNGHNTIFLLIARGAQINPLVLKLDK